MFLDTVSPFAKFNVIEENNIVQSINILNQEDNKISDCIIPAFLKLENKIQIKNKIKKLIICNGPGSYTALRVGISFFYGLSFSMNIPLISISCPDILKFVIPKSDIVKSLIFIVSSNNQHFFCTFNYNKKLNIEKLNLKTITKLLETKKYTHTFSNYKLPYEINEIIDINKHQTIGFEKILSYNYKKIDLLKHQKMINPIYISDNKVLN